MWGTQPGRGPRLSSASRPCSVPQPAPPAPCRAQRGCRPASGRPAGGPHSPVPEPPRPPSAAAGAEGAPGDPWPGRQQGARDPVLGAGAWGLETRSTEKTPGGEARGRRGGAGRGLYSRSRRSLGTEGCGTNGPLLPGGALLARGCRDSPAPRARLSLAPRWRRVAGTLVLDTLRDNIGVVRDTWLKASQTFICPRITWKSSDTDAAPAGLG